MERDAEGLARAGNRERIGERGVGRVDRKERGWEGEMVMGRLWGGGDGEGGNGDGEMGRGAIGGGDGERGRGGNGEGWNGETGRGQRGG